MTIPAEQEETPEKDCCPLLQGSRALEPDDLSVFELYSSEDGCLTFCLDVLADEEVVFGRRLSSEKEDSYIMAYAIYDEAAGQVCDMLDIELRLPYDEEWFHCKLSDEMKKSLKQKMDAFCGELYGEHLPEPQAKCQGESGPSQMGPVM